MATTFESPSYQDGTGRVRRSLEIPPPPGQREIVVVQALKTLANKRKDVIDTVEDAIEANGITIEVARLRDRLTHLALGDTERLLLSTPGVTEKLFFKAIEEELEEEYDDDYRDYRIKDFLAELLRYRAGEGGAQEGMSAPAQGGATSTGAGGPKGTTGSGSAGGATRAAGAGKTAQTRAAGTGQKAPPAPDPHDSGSHEGTAT
jgi:hypothetical protein